MIITIINDAQPQQQQQLHKHPDMVVTKEEAAERRKERGPVPRLATLNQIPAAEPTNQLGEDG